MWQIEYRISFGGVVADNAWVKWGPELKSEAFAAGALWALRQALNTHIFDFRVRELRE